MDSFSRVARMSQELGIGTVSVEKTFLQFDDDHTDDHNFRRAFSGPLPSRLEVESSVSDSEGVLDREPAWSRGSALHDEGSCKACAWYWKGDGCARGVDCQFCHLCPRGALRRAKATKVIALKTERRREKAAKAKEARASMQHALGAASSKGAPKPKSKTTDAMQHDMGAANTKGGSKAKMQTKDAMQQDTGSAKTKGGSKSKTKTTDAVQHGVFSGLDAASTKGGSKSKTKSSDPMQHDMGAASIKGGSKSKLKSDRGDNQLFKREHLISAARRHPVV